jgi:hypothetical protein
MAPKKDFTQVALDVVRRATGETDGPPPKDEDRVAAGRSGGLARKSRTTPEQRRESAVKAAKTRWKK